jgi:hypothetical protein
MKKIIFILGAGSNHSSDEVNVSANANAVINPLKQQGCFKILKNPIIYLSSILSCLLVLITFTFTSIGCEKLSSIRLNSNTMKPNLLLAIIVLFFITGWQVQGQQYSEFAPVGAEWYYTYTNGEPLMDCHKYRVEKDTLIDGDLCKMVIHSFYNTVRDTVIFKQDNGKIYYYFNEQFNLIYDYDVQISDEVVFTFKCYGCDAPGNTVLLPVRCIVNDIQQIEINGRQYKQVFTTIDTSFENRWFHVAFNNNYDYIEGIGHLHVFMEEARSMIDLSVYTIELRCYGEDDFHYITPWWQGYDNLPCDYLGYSSINKSNPMDGISVFPNPVQNELYLTYPEIQNLVSGEILSPTGQSLLNFTIDNQNKSVNLNNLSSGIYFLKYQINEKNIIRKIIKQ